MTIPTLEQASDNSEMRWTDVNGEQVGFACWYPQMGGYVARCIIHPHNNGCFDAYVWHDGEFPFDETDGRSPARIHHCDAQQFIEFGKFAAGVCK